MKSFGNCITEWLKADFAVISDTNAENFGDVAEKISADVPKVENVKNEELEKVLISMESKKNDATFSIQSADVADDVPIYTATAEEINYWHACVNLHISHFLSRYDFDESSVAFDSFKIGVDTESHAVTFALDETHYLKIRLNDTNVRPLDEEQAEKVLRKVNSMRFEKNQAYCLKVWKW